MLGGEKFFTSGFKSQRILLIFVSGTMDFMVVVKIFENFMILNPNFDTKVIRASDSVDGFG